MYFIRQPNSDFLCRGSICRFGLEERGCLDLNVFWLIPEDTRLMRNWEEDEETREGGGKKIRRDNQKQILPKWGGGSAAFKSNLTFC